MTAARKIWRAKAATEVFPLVPVTATIVSLCRAKNLAAASATASARVGDFDEGRAGDVGRAFGDDRRRALGERFGGVLEPIVLDAAEREKKVAGLGLAAVRAKSGDLELGERLALCGKV